MYSLPKNRAGCTFSLKPGHTLDTQLHGALVDKPLSSIASSEEDNRRTFQQLPAFFFCRVFPAHDRVSVNGGRRACPWIEKGKGYIVNKLWLEEHRCLFSSGPDILASFQDVCCLFCGGEESGRSISPLSYTKLIYVCINIYIYIILCDLCDGMMISGFPTCMFLHTVKSVSHV